MKQIKTIIDKNPEAFDKEVNDALADGWKLTRRDVFPGHYFLAEMERDDAEPKREDIDYEAKLCEDCKHFDAKCGEEPCLSCTDEGSNWEAKV